MLTRTFVLLFLLAVANQDDVRGQGTGCGRRPSMGKRIIGGKNSTAHSWPWMCTIFYKNEKEINCGGTLINDQWVVTAAHCFGALKPNPKNFTIVVGENNIYKKDPFEQRRDVAKILLHPKYKPFDPADITTPDYDIALAKLDRPVNLNSRVSPICLLSFNQLTFGPGKECYLTGWGDTDLHRTYPATLREIKGKIVSLSVCNKEVYGNSLTQRYFCVGFKQNGTGNWDGDSGSPLACEKDGRYYLKGIVVGNGGSAPAKYAYYNNMTLLTPWMRQTIRCHH